MVEVACGVLLLAAGLFVIQPLLREPKGNLEAELLAETDLDRLLNRKAVVYSNLKELEFEYKLGRLSDADFRRLEAGYKSEAALILRQLDALGVEKNLDELLERDVASRRAKQSSAERQKRSSAERPDAARCPSCGAAVAQGKRFCGDCGHRLS